MKFISAVELAAVADYRSIVEALRDGFRTEIESPVRHSHDTSGVAKLMLMPAWSKAWTGLKTVVVKSDNPGLGLPTVQASYLLIDNGTGAPVAIMDGTELTRRRTAAASALAADYLARPDASHLVVVGAGALAAHFVRAHAAVRPIKKITIHNRTPGKAEKLAAELRGEGLDAVVAADPETAVRQADIVSSITSSTKPGIRGQWLKPGTHVDLAGAFTPLMRETDGDVVAKSRVFVDTRHGAEAEAGDLLQARDEGKFDFADIQGDLFELCRGAVPGRKTAEEITLFKSCGSAIEDLAAAIMVYLRCK
jgi:ornithine cyclodeaminase/alanine dehydrogenase-like protein (mu-crystallin family)